MASGACAMVDEGRARGRAETWRPWLPPWAAGGSGPASRPAWAWPDGLARGAAQRIRDWIAVEVGPGRLVPWLAIAFGLRHRHLFHHRPGACVLGGDRAAGRDGRSRDPGAASADRVSADGRRRRLAAGFATATIKRAVIAHPVLSAPVWNVEIGGFVEAREERERSDRITVRVERHRRAAPQRAARARAGVGAQGHGAGGRQLRRVQGAAVAAARAVAARRLRLRTRHVFPAASAPRASCSVVSAPRRRRTRRRLRLRYAMRHRRHARGDRQAHPRGLAGDKGAIASALITGKRDAISTPVNEAMYVSGLAHVLSISGYHMAVVAGIMFFVMRALFALMPAFADRHPIKKWAARRRPLRGRVLFAPVGRGGRDPALLHHDRDRAHRRDGRSPDADLPHAHGRGASACCCWRPRRSCIRASRCRLRRPWRSLPATSRACPG